MGTREHIIGAAERVMSSKGLAAATTREIAREAGLSEGALYRHFKNKEELFLHVLKESPSNFIVLVKELPRRAGTGTIRANLTEVATAALAFYHKSLPVGASLFADPELLGRFRELMRQGQAGPQKANEAVAAYLRAEQEHGRLSDAVDAEAAASLLLGACFQKAYLAQFLGADITAEEAERFVERLLRALELGL